jgi:hypothetical protein
MLVCAVLSIKGDDMTSALTGVRGALKLNHMPPQTSAEVRRDTALKAQEFILKLPRVIRLRDPLLRRVLVDLRLLLHPAQAEAAQAAALSVDSAD